MPTRSASCKASAPGLQACPVSGNSLLDRSVIAPGRHSTTLPQAQGPAPFRPQSGLRISGEVMSADSRPSVLRSSVGVLFLLLFVPALLFGAAGTLAWPMGWAYVALSTVGTAVPHLLVAQRHPDVLRERARGFKADNVESWDRRILPILIWSSVLTLIVAGVDHRLGWSPTPKWRLQPAALVPAAVGYALTGWAMVTNRFFSGTVRIQADRGHEVVSSGPYRMVRHPGYAGSLIATLSVPLVLGSWWTYVPATAAAAALIVRTALEDAMLRRELTGYSEYARGTRHRLVPGVW